MSANQLIAVDYCRRCGDPLRAGDHFCAHCGSAAADLSCVSISAAPPVRSLAPQHASPPVIVIAPPGGGLREALDNRWLVVGVLICIGPLGLPALWLSRSFSPTTKTITTIGYFLLTAVAPVVIGWYLLDYTLWPLVDAFRPVRP